MLGCVCVIRDTWTPPPLQENILIPKGYSLKNKK